MVVLVDGTAVTILDAVDQRRCHLAATVVEHGVSRDHFQKRRLAGAEREREILREIVVDTKAPRILADERHADVLRQPHRHDIAGMLDAETQRRGAVEFALVVFRPPDARAGVDLKRCIHHDG